MESPYKELSNSQLTTQPFLHPAKQFIMEGLYFISFFLFLITTCNGKQEEQIFKIPNKYPHFYQCDAKWAKDIMIDTTICRVGCLISSVSMAFNYHNITVNGTPINPGVLNEWLRNNNGYEKDNGLKEKILENLSPRITYTGMTKTLSSTKTIEYLNSGIVTIAHVRNATHFVLMTGYTPNPSQNWLVNDPYFNQTVYTTQEIVDYRIFSIKH